MKSIMSNKKSFFAGARDVSPILLGVVPFGLITGVVGVNVGMSELETIGTSLIIFAGASQLVAMQLMAEHASIAVIIMTGLVINARMLMYSASIAPHLNGMHPLKKAILAYGLTDQAYAVAITRFDQDDSDTISKPLYYLGAAIVMWASFNLTTAIGAYLGAVIPAHLNLEFAIPLTFIALVVPSIKDRPALLAAAVAGVISLLANNLPFNLGLMLAAFIAIFAGYALERRQANG